MNNRKLIAAVSAVVICLVVVYFVGSKVGFDSGYAQAQADLQQLNEEAANKAGAEAAKAANPFGAVNPLEGVQANPFEKAQKVLNPFE